MDTADWITDFTDWLMEAADWFMDYTDLQVKGSHGFHGKHETRLTRGRDYTDSNRFHGRGPLRGPTPGIEKAHADSADSADFSQIGRWTTRIICGIAQIGLWISQICRDRRPRIPRKTRNTPDPGPRLHGFQQISRKRAAARPHAWHRKSSRRFRRFRRFFADRSLDYADYLWDCTDWFMDFADLPG